MSDSQRHIYLYIDHKFYDTTKVRDVFKVLQLINQL